MQNKRFVGSEYEEKAVEYLIKNGYRILDRNYHAGRKGEIDILAENEKGMLIACECKYRRNYSCGDPLEAVDWKKQKQICKTLLFYYNKKGFGLDHPCRFDVIAIYGNGEIKHIKNAFDFIY